MTRILPIAIAWLAMLSAGCGFTLRGQSLLPDTMQRVYLEAEDLNSALVQQLEQALRHAGAEVVQDRAGATSTLRIVSDSAGQRVLSVSAQGQPQEYELYHTVVFDLSNIDGALVAPTTLTLTQDYFFDEQDILGISEDAEFLTGALTERVARTIVRRAALAARAGGSK